MSSLKQQILEEFNKIINRKDGYFISVPSIQQQKLLNDFLSQAIDRVDKNARQEKNKELKKAGTVREKLQKQLVKWKTEARWLRRNMKTVQAEATKKRDEKNRKSKLYVDATPDGNYALRLLQMYRDDCDIRWSDNTAGLKISNPMIEALNEMQDKRAKELDEAIEKLLTPTPGEGKEVNKNE